MIRDSIASFVVYLFDPISHWLDLRFCVDPWKPPKQLQTGKLMVHAWHTGRKMQRKHDYRTLHYMVIVFPTNRMRKKRHSCHSFHVLSHACKHRRWLILVHYRWKSESKWDHYNHPREEHQCVAAPDVEFIINVFVIKSIKNSKTRGKRCREGR